MDIDFLLSFIAITLLILFVLHALGLLSDTREKNQMAIESLKKRRNELYTKRIKKLEEREALAKQEKINKLGKDIADKAGIKRSQLDSKYRNKMLAAGIRDPNAIYQHFFTKVVVAIAVFILSAFVFLHIDPFKLDLPPNIGIIAVSTIIGFIYPDIRFDGKIQERINRIRRSFPDALDMIVVCAESGLGINSALKRVSQEMHDSSPDMSDEIAQTSIELSFFENREMALENFAERIDLPQVKSFTSTLIQSEKFGTPIAASLRILSSEFREERMMLAEEKASALPAKMTIPLMLCVLPSLMIVLLTPAVIQVIDLMS